MDSFSPPIVVTAQSAPLSLTIRTLSAVKSRELPFGYAAILNLIGVPLNAGQQIYSEAVGVQNANRDRSRAQGIARLKDMIPLINPGIVRDFERAQEKNSIAPIVFGASSMPLTPRESARKIMRDRRNR